MAVVTWQNVFWTLPPLAINTMLQPSGSVCGFDIDLRTYLCISPIVCAADSFAILIRFLVCWIHLGSPDTAAHATLAARFPGPSQEAPNTQGPQALEHLPFARWIFGFLLGALPAWIKLLSFKGVPWTQAWGCMFLVQFVLIETLGMLQRLDRSPPTTGLLTFRTQQMLRFVDWLCGKIALVTHFMLSIWFLHSLSQISTFANWLWSRSPDTTNVGIAAFSTMAAFPGIVWVGLTLFIKGRNFAGNTLFMTHTTKSLIFLFALATNIAWPVGYSYTSALSRRARNEQTAIHGIGWDVIVFVVALPIGLSVSIITERLAIFQWWKEHILFCQRGAPRSSIETAAWTFTMFLSTVVLAVLWYAFRYEPQGTLKPSWAEVFG
ncbi:hypothetical protein EJ08DRAFT_649416 [Tothia fuscella]|uniref:Uncharacterized protein n=1 Tax=Tothia fuscella TaxID=1048955 RepID=A0A9P4TZF8_9PEZI|nr:hypothetical protein EJ08DRAFT_649416 [Tothia fuscella]